MQRCLAFLRTLTCLMLCTALLVMTLNASAAHDPAHAIAAAETLQTGIDHGHSHDDPTDLYWDLHGHAEDVIDHDHSVAALLLSPESSGFAYSPLRWRPARIAPPSPPVLSSERPPRGLA